MYEVESYVVAKALAVLQRDADASLGADGFLSGGSDLFPGLAARREILAKEAANVAKDVEERYERLMQKPEIKLNLGEMWVIAFTNWRD